MKKLAQSLSALMDVIFTVYSCIVITSIIENKEYFIPNQLSVPYILLWIINKCVCYAASEKE